MVRKILKADVARALGVSDSLVSRYARRGMPTHDLELAARWYDANVRPSMRTALRQRALAVPAPYALTLDELADLVEAAGPELVALLHVECGLALDQAELAVSCHAGALHAALAARGVESDLWELGAPPQGTPALAAWRAQLEARVARLRAEYASSE